MRTIVSWIRDNKEWVFSGIGIPIVVLFYSGGFKMLTKIRNYLKKKTVSKVPETVKEKSKESLFFSKLNEAVRGRVSKSESDRILQLSKELSYRQLCLLAIFGNPRKSELGNNSKKSDVYISDLFHYDLLKSEFYDLIEKKKLIYSIDPIKYVMRYDGKPIHIFEATVTDIELTGLGKLLYDLMDLKEIDNTEIENVIDFDLLADFLIKG